MWKISLNKFIIIASAISALTYLLFFSQIFVKDHFFWGSDVRIYYHPARVYLHETITEEGRFPFWTERQYSGFPIYADFETAFLHPGNIISLIALGPMLSYRVLHLLSYLAGSIALFALLRRRKVGWLPAIVAHLIYYFSFFNINHQIHYNIIMVTYLFPLKILLAEMFLEKKQFRYILFQALVLGSGFYWGHMQTVVISIIGITSYMFVFTYKKEQLKVFINYMLILGLLCLIQIIPLVMTAYSLYIESPRLDEVSQRFGSLVPSLFSLAIYPFLFGRQPDYTGVLIHTQYTYTEFYIYFGISTFILILSSLLFLKRNRDYYFGYLVIALFFVLTFIGNLPFISENTPIISHFRYWVRISYVTLLGSGILVALMLQKLIDDKLFERINRKKLIQNLLLVIALPVYLLILVFIRPKEVFTFSLIDALNIKEIVSSLDFKIWLLILILTSLIMLGILILKTIRKVKFNSYITLTLVGFLALILVFDLRYFAQDVLNFRIQNYNKDINALPTDLPEYANDRIMIIGGEKEIEGMEYLYYKSWTPFGYSQLKSDSYTQHVKRLGIITPNVNRTIFGGSEGYTNLVPTGVVTVDNLNSGQIFHINNNPINILDSRIDGEYITKEEGHIEFRIFNNEVERRIGTFIRSDSNWNLFINGEPVLLDHDGIYLRFMLPEGENIRVEFKYIPRDLYLGLRLMVIATIVFIVSYWYLVFHRKINLW